MAHTSLSVFWSHPASVAGERILYQGKLRAGSAASAGALP
jgi:hypothetical protein